MFHLPNQSAIRSTSSYTSAFTLTLLWNVGLFGMLCFVLFVIFLAIKIYYRKQNREMFERASLMTTEERGSTGRINPRQSQTIQIEPLLVNPDTKKFKIVNFFTSFFFYLMWVDIALLYLVFFMFGYLGRSTGISVFTIFVMVLIVGFPTLIWKYKTKVKPSNQIKKEIAITILLCVFWLGVCVFLVIATKGICVCLFNEKYGFIVDSDLQVSSEWTRSLTLDKVCQPNEVCHIYATLPEDTSTSVFINVHAGVNVQNLTAIITLNGNVLEKKKCDEYFQLTNVESLGQRNVFSILFAKLTANTTYSIEIINTITNSSLEKVNYKTLPDETTSSIRLAVGGDIGITSKAQKLNQYLVEYNPDVILIGGDTVYDDGMRTCYYSWDNFYQLFQTVNKKLNRIVPFILTVGNHDVGFDALAGVSLSKALTEIPLFFALHPQHSHTTLEVPPIPERLSYHFHKLGPSIQFNLDSGYLIPFEQQASFIELYSQKYPNYYKFSNYHNPVYPSCTDYTPNSNDIQVITNATKYWTPLFDRYNFTASLEHHTHFRKFTQKIKNNTLHPDGIRYIGDGSWGVKETICQDFRTTQNKERFEDFVTEKPNHIWLITLTKKGDAKAYSINYTTVDLSGKVAFQKIQDLPTL